MTRRRSGRFSVGRLVGWSVCHNFLKGCAGSCTCLITDWILGPYLLSLLYRNSKLLFLSLFLKYHLICAFKWCSVLAYLLLLEMVSNKINRTFFRTLTGLWGLETTILQIRTRVNRLSRYIGTGTLEQVHRYIGTGTGTLVQVYW